MRHWAAEKSLLAGDDPVHLLDMEPQAGAPEMSQCPWRAGERLSNAVDRPAFGGPGDDEQAQLHPDPCLGSLHLARLAAPARDSELTAVSVGSRRHTGSF